MATLDPTDTLALHRHKVIRMQRIQDFIFEKTSMTFAMTTLVVLLGIIASLFISAWPALVEFGFPFFYTIEWDIINSKFGGLIAIFGTVATASIAILIALPLSFGIAVFLTETCPKPLRRPLGTAIELLAAVPSIIYGMFGLFVFAPLFAEYIQPAIAATLGQIPGLGFLFDIVPPILTESAYGLGCTTWEVVTNIVLPYTKTGVVGGVMLGLGRALGETMAVTFVIGNAHKLSPSLFSPGNSIASTLANEFGEAEPGLHYSSLFALALALFIITLIVLSLAKWMLLRAEAKKGFKS